MDPTALYSLLDIAGWKNTGFNLLNFSVLFCLWESLYRQLCFVMVHVINPHSLVIHWLHQPRPLKKKSLW